MGSREIKKSGYFKEVDQKGEKPVIKAVIFDLDGTLLNRDASLRDFINGQYERLHPWLSHIPKETYISRFIELDNRGYTWKDKVYEEIRKEFKIEKLTKEELLQDYLDYFKEHCIPFPNLLKTLEQLQRKGFRLGMITNGRGQFQMDNIQALHIDRYIDTILISEWEGMKKPDPFLFQKAAEQLGHPPSECIYIGDHPKNDVEAAKAAGMTGIWKKDPQWRGVEADYIIEDLSEVLSFVQHPHSQKD